MNEVDQDTKKTVEIKSGWLTRQFLHYVLNIEIPDDQEITWREDVGAIQTTGGTTGHFWVELNRDFLLALHRFDDLVVQKDYQYESSWQTLGVIIPMGDMIDKLARLQGASRNGAALKWDPNKKLETQFDLLVRNLMIMCWEGLNFQDDDDDRRPTS